MKFAGKLLLAALVVTMGAVYSQAGINSKEVGSVLIYPEYRASSPSEDPNASLVDTYITVTNDKAIDMSAHIEVISGTACDDCNFDLPLTGFQTKRLRLTRRQFGSIWATVIYDASPHSQTGNPFILTACPDAAGFIVVTLEAEDVSPRTTLGDNALHGDSVVVDLSLGTSSQLGAVAVQGVGVNNGDRNLDFDNMEYAAFPSIVTTNFWSPNTEVDPRLVLFNVNFKTGQWPKPVTHCSINYSNAEEVVYSRSFSFDCWDDPRLSKLAPGFNEDILGTANGFMWIQCDAGTHGAIVTDIHTNGQQRNYPYAADAEYRDTLFQSVTTREGATLEMTPSIIASEVQTDIAITKTDDVDPVMAGESLTYTLTITNEGPADGREIQVTDTLPAGVVLRSVTASDWSCSTATGSVTCTRPELADGGSAEIRISVDIDSSVPDGTVLANSANVQSSGTDPDTSNNSVTEETTVAGSADLSILKVDSADPVFPSDTLTYTVTVDNSGPSDALDVSVSDTLPAGLTLVSTSGCDEDPAGLPACTLGTIPAGGSAAYSITVSVDSLASGVLSNTATVTSTTSDPDPSNNSATEETSVVTEADLSVTKTDSVDPVAAGGTITYTVTVNNAGPGPAIDVTATDALPAGLTQVQTAGCLEDPVGVPTCSLGTIGVGESAVYTVTAIVDGGVSVLNNVVSVDAGTTDPDPSNNTADEETGVIPVADLSVIKIDDQDPVMAGGPLTWTVTVSNAGPSAADNVVGVDTLPAGVTLVSTSGCVEDPAGIPSCSLGSIAAGGTAAYSITVMVDSGAMGSLSNQVSVTSSTADPDTSNNSVVENTGIETAGGLSVSQHDMADPVSRGGAIAYEITVTNDGPSDARDVVATGTLPSAMVFTATSGCSQDPGGAPTCSLGTIPAGGSAVYMVSGTVANGANGPLSHLVHVTSSTPDHDLSDNTSVESTGVTSATADVQVAVTNNTTQARRRQILTYTISLYNAGPDEAEGVIVFGALPVELDLISTTGCSEDPGAAPTCTIGTLAPGEIRQISIVTQVGNPGSHIVRYEVTVTGSTPDPDGSNNTAFDETVYGRL